MSQDKFETELIMLTHQQVYDRREYSCAVNIYGHPLTQQLQGSQETEVASANFIWRCLQVSSQVGEVTHGEDLGE